MAGGVVTGKVAVITGGSQPAPCFASGHERRAGGVPGLPLQHRRGILRVLEILGGGGLLQGPQAQEIGHRHHDRGLAAQVDHLVRTGVRAGRVGLGGHPVGSSSGRRGPAT